MIRKLPLIALFLSGCLVAPAQAQFSFGELFKKKSDQLMEADEYTDYQSTAQARLAKARSQESSGKTRQARDAYRSIVKAYPRTDAAAEAQYFYAAILDRSGEEQKAFKAYQELLTNYRNTTHFSEAVGRQYAIATSLKDGSRKGFLGFGTIQPSVLIEMFQQISASAPQTDFAPKSLLSIGKIHNEQQEAVEALSAFTQIVNAYGGTPYATEAQYEIFQIRGEQAEDSNSPVEDRAQVEAGIDFVNQNPQDQRAAEIRSNLEQIETRSMEKLYNTGRFYEKSGKPESARVYYREVVKNPNTPWAAKAQERLAIIDNAPEPVEKRASFFGANPLKKDTVEMRTSDDEVLPLPVSEES